MNGGKATYFGAEVPFDLSTITAVVSIISTVQQWQSMFMHHQCTLWHGMAFLNSAWHCSGLRMR